MLAHWGLQKELLKDRDFDPSFSMLLDVTQVTKFDFSAADVRVLAEARIFSPRSRRAFLVSSDLAFGYGRMFEMLREGMGETGIRVFRNLEEALEWVLAKESMK